LFTTSNHLIFTTRQIFSEISEIVLKNVFPNWTTRLSWVMKNGANTTLSNYVFLQGKRKYVCYDQARIDTCLTPGPFLLGRGA
jgi:hypothetical protein